MTKNEILLLSLGDFIEDVLGFLFYLYCLGLTVCAVWYWCKEFRLRRKDSNVGIEVDSYFWSITGVLLALGVLAIFIVHGLWYLSFFNIDLREFFGQVYFLILLPLLFIRYF